MSTDLLNWLDDCQALVKFAQPVAQTGKLVRVAGLVMEAVGLKLPVGSVCTVVQKGTPDLEAEVVGFSGERLFLMPSTDVHGMTPGARVIPQEPPAQAPQTGTKSPPLAQARGQNQTLARGRQPAGPGGGQQWQTAGQPG